jgi:hypothetical protein
MKFYSVYINVCNNITTYYMISFLVIFFSYQLGVSIPSDIRFRYWRHEKIQDVILKKKFDIILLIF